ncbi:unnamed protein product [Paramecium sonneborni]|uniref:Transmembrane protein n=1 Tax=Paramecium sonneborni TaxID=65129 RepID=A0A8S1LUN3_9CILI|nr:unnamed protein product [Paramecium sonneborni]
MPKIFENISKAFLKLKNEFAYQLDIFGQLPSFTVLNRSKYTSKLGFLLSLLIGTLSAYYLIIEITSMISKSKPSIYQTEVQVIETDSYYLNDQNFTLAISIANRFSQPLIGINKYFNLNVSQCTRERIRDQITGNLTVTLKCVEMPIEPCNMSHFTTDLQKEYFKTIRFGGVQCINRDYLKMNPPVLKGQFNALEYKYLYIQFTTCKNTTNQQNCAPQEEIDDVLQAGHYNVYKTDYLSQLDHPGQPYKQIITNEFTGFSSSTSKTIVQQYRIIQTKTDEGLIWEEENIQRNIQQTEWREISDFYNQQYLVLHIVRLDFKQTNNLRTYIKLQTILAKLGGILQIFIMFVAIISKPIIENLMKLEIANSLFRFDQLEKEVQTQTKTQVIQTEREFQSPMNIENKQNEILNNRKNQKLNNSFIDTFLIIFGLQKEKNQQFLKAKKKIIKNLDIVTILKRLQEIDLLKKILFTKEQIEILKNLPPPLINSKAVVCQRLTEVDLEKDNKTNISPLQCQQIKYTQSPFIPKLIPALSKSYIDNQLQQYLDNCNDQSKNKGRFSNSILRSPCTPASNIQLYKCDEIDEPTPQKPKK